MDWEFDIAEAGNIALTGELDLRAGHEFTLGMAFGDSEHDAQTTLLQALGVPFKQQLERFVEQWHRVCSHMCAIKHAAADGGCLSAARSHSLLLAHEDKHFPARHDRFAQHPLGRIQR